MGFLCLFAVVCVCVCVCVFCVFVGVLWELGFFVDFLGSGGGA